ncbi:MAG TPA: ATP-binding protein [Rickettsia endosymbiont of Sericostoma sp. HW-2014]|nr:ATP-binding protein [Rickettsia endosymbiont of Sericostoma sp. HW-2014]
MTKDKTKNNNYQPRMLVGSDDFKKLLLKSDIFVDKSLMIKELLEDSGDVILITRPRRWGKSLNMDMVRRFFEIEVDDHGKQLPQEQMVNPKLFVGGKVDLGFDEIKQLKPLKISAYPNVIKRQGQFPVIFITFKSVEGSSYHDIEQGMKEQIHQLFQGHHYLSDSNKLNQYEKADFDIYLSQARELTIENIKSSLSLLSKLLYKHYNRKPWVLIDEYDTPINSAYRRFGSNKEEFENVLDIFRGIMKSVFKKETGDQELPVECGVVTGILRIAKAELFSGLNNPTEYSLLDENFASSYGFTQEEVDELLSKVPTTTNSEEIKNWYNGYNFGGEIIYNPWSIMRCLAQRGKLDNYWIDSGGTGWVDNVFVSDEVQEDLNKLLEGKAIVKKLYKQISFADLEDNPNVFYSLLLFAGYLSPLLANDNKEDPRYSLSIPNREVRNIYVERVIQWFTKKLNIKMNEYDNFIDLLINQQIDKFEEKLQSYLLRSTSYHDLTEEKDYHNLVGGLLAPLTTRYNIESNREVGHGRCDHILTSIVGRGDNAIIFECKVAKSSEDLLQIAKVGLEQIIDRKYDSKIKEYSHVKQILKISMAFYGKNMELQYEVTKL